MSRARVPRALIAVFVVLLLHARAVAVAQRIDPGEDGGTTTASELAGRVVGIADGDTLRC